MLLATQFDYFPVIKNSPALKSACTAMPIIRTKVLVGDLHD